MYNLMIPKNPNSIIFQDYKFRFFYNEEFINNHFKKLDDNQYALEWVDYINATINLNNVENFDDFSKIIVKGFDKTYLFTVMSIQFNSADKRNVTLRLELDMIFELSKIDNWAINGTVKYSTFKELTLNENMEVNKNTILNREGITASLFFDNVTSFDTPVVKYKVFKSIEGYVSPNLVLAFGTPYSMSGNVLAAKGYDLGLVSTGEGTKNLYNNLGPYYAESKTITEEFNYFNDTTRALLSSDNIVKSYISIIPTCFLAPSLSTNIRIGKHWKDMFDASANEDLKYMFKYNIKFDNGYFITSSYLANLDRKSDIGVFYNDGNGYFFTFQKAGGSIAPSFSYDALIAWFNIYDNRKQFCVLYQSGKVLGAEWDDAWIGDDKWHDKFKSKAKLKVTGLFYSNNRNWLNITWPRSDLYLDAAKMTDVWTRIFYKSVCRLLGTYESFPIHIPLDYTSWDEYDILKDGFNTSINDYNNYGVGTKDAYGFIGLEYDFHLSRKNYGYHYYDYKIYNHEEFVDVFISTFTCFSKLENWSQFVQNSSLVLKLNEFPSLQANSILRVQYYNGYHNPTKNYQWIELASSLEVRSSDWYNYLLSNSSQYQTAKSYADTQLKLTKQQAKWDTANSVFNGISNTISSIMGGALFSTMFGGSGVALGSVGAWSSVGSGITGIGSTVVSNKQKIASAQNAVNQLNAQQEDLSRSYSLDYQAVNYINSRKQQSYDCKGGISFITFTVNDATAEVLKKHFFMYGWKIGMIYRVNKDLFTRDFEYLEMENCVFEETPVINQDAIIKLLKDGIFVFNNKKDYNEITSLYQLNDWS